MDLRKAGIRAQYRISQILAKGSLQRGSLFDVKRLENKLGKPRFIIIVSKKSSPKAVERNRIKRRVREALRIVAARMELGCAALAAPTGGPRGMDFSIIAKSHCLTATFDNLVGELGRQLGAPIGTASR